MPRKLFTWNLKSRELRLGDRTLIVAILNVTPDSFSDGGLYDDPDLATARAIELEAQGADILDIGAESTKPGSARVSAAEELRRLIPVLKRLKGQLSIPISVDTYKAEVAALAIEHGAEIINDPSGFTFDPLLAKVVVENDAGLILNHMRGTPETWAKLPPAPDIMSAVVKDLDASANRARRSGVEKSRMVLDPGLGFGKRKEQNSEIVARLRELVRLDYPILTGPSRKSFLAQSSEQETLFATAAAVTASVLNGAHMVRVHDVAAMRAVISVAEEILRAERGVEEEAPKRPVGRRVVSPETPATERASPARPPLLKNFSPPPPAPAEDRPRQEISERPAARPGGGDRQFTPRRDSEPKPGGPFQGDREGGPPRRSGPPADRGERRPFSPRGKSGPGGDRPFRGDREGGPPRRNDRPTERRSERPADGEKRPFPPRRAGSAGPDGPRKSSGPRKFSDGPRKFSGGPRKFSSGPRKFGSGPRKFSSGPRKFGPPRKSGPRKDPPNRGPKRDS